jgi:hypothetical protein
MIMQKQIVIACATAEDLENVVDQLEQRCREEDFSVSPFDRVKVSKLVGHLLAQKDGIVLVARDGERIVGCVVGAVIERWFSSERAAYPCAFYVLPESRSSAALERLLWEFQAQALKRKARLCEATVISSAISSHSISALERTGFIAVAQQFAWAPAAPTEAVERNGVH